jgi:hypothetical protein
VFVQVAEVKLYSFHILQANHEYDETDISPSDHDLSSYPEFRKISSACATAIRIQTPTILLCHAEEPSLVAKPTSFWNVEFDSSSLQSTTKEHNSIVRENQCFAMLKFKCSIKSLE